MARVSRQLKKLFRNRAIILMYHRIVEPCIDPWRLCVTPSHFNEHLEVLARNWRVLSLRGLAEGLQEGGVPHRTVVLTFDDGYACSLLAGKPLLEKHDVSATLFVASGLVGKDEEPWWDELEAILLRPSSLPKELDLVIDGEVCHWDVNGAASAGAEEIAAHRTTYPWEAAADSRLALYYAVWQALRRSSADARQAALRELRRWGRYEAPSRPTHRMLTYDEVVSVADGEAVELGSHTVTHPLLTALSAESQRAEMQECQQALSKLAGAPIDMFSYPHGEYDCTTLKIASDLRFSCACTTTHETVTRGSGILELPRFQVEDWDGDQFERQLRQWMWR